MKTTTFVRSKINGMDTDDPMIDLAWGLIRDWRRRRDVDLADRLGWVRLY